MATFEGKQKPVACLKALGILLVLAIVAAGGCKGGSPGNAVWYQWSKTLEQADDDCRECYYEAVKYARAQSQSYEMSYAPEDSTLGDYRDQYAIRGHGVGEDSVVRSHETLASGQNSYTALRDRQMNRCMIAKGYRIRSSRDLGDNLAIREVPVAGDHWVAGLDVSDSNSADPNSN